MTTAYAGVDSFPATIPLPQDSVDKRSASIMNPCWQGCFDGARWCKNRIGAFFAAQVVHAHDLSDATAVGDNDGDDWSTGNSYEIWDGGVTCPDVEPSDVLDVQVAFHGQHVGGTPALVWYDLLVGAYASSVNYSVETALIKSFEGSGITAYTLSSCRTWTLAAVTGKLFVAVRCKWGTDPGADHCAIYTPMTARVTIWRPTS